jgi:UDP-N-acetylglucosamine 2-epimerase (non-hydrolysing)
MYPEASKTHRKISLMKNKITIIVGARPNFVKVSPIMKAVARHNNSSPRSFIDVKLVHTGQHYDYEMSQIFFDELEIPQPDIHLGIGSGTHAEQTGRTMIEVEKILVAEKPGLVMVVGDVNATLAGSLAAAKLNIPVAHVEAGIRSFDRTMPEEINRLITDHLSEYLFTTSAYDDDNLKKEGILPARIYRVGNIVADSLLQNREIAARSGILTKLGLKARGYVLMTLHRPSNVDDKPVLDAILKAVVEISQRIPVVFPVHLRTRKNINAFGLMPLVTADNSNIILTDPLGYLSLLNLEMDSKFVITDSGGIQVETTVLGVPCLTLLDSPVWKITHDMGMNILVGSSPEKLKSEAFRLLDSTGRTGKVPDLWDGRTADRIIEILAGKAKQ